ncbi:MAG: DUF3078 domain-containing protein [Flavobacteriales bacterium]
MKKVYFVFLAAISTFNIYAQVNPLTEKEKEELEKKLQAQALINDSLVWKKGGLLGLNFSQVQLVNWAGGGNSTMAATGILNLYAGYKKNNTTWDSSLDMAYGLISQNNAPFFKSDDRIEINSKYGHKASEKLYYAGLFNLRTQFAPGYNTPADTVFISNFLVPAFSILALGFDYKPTKHLTFFLSPATIKTTVVNDQRLADAGAFGVQKAEIDSFGVKIVDGKKIRHEAGAFFKMMYKKEDIVKNVNLMTRIDLFSNYFNNPQNIDVNWELLISMKVNKYLSASISTLLIYDDDIQIAVDTNNDGILDGSGPRIQFREVLSIGLSYKF